MINKDRWERQPVGQLGFGGGNYILRPKDGSRFAISFQPDSTEANLGIFAGNADQETAICDYEADRYYVLNGDHSSEYEELIDLGLSACMEYFNKHKDKQRARPLPHLDPLEALLGSIRANLGALIS